MDTHTAIDIHRFPTLEAAVQGTGESMQQRLMGGYYVRSVSHAMDPDGGDRKWSVIIVYGEIGPDDKPGGLSVGLQA